MATTIVGDHAKAVLREKKHLAIPSVGVKRPAVRERYDRAFAPILIVDLAAILGGDCVHVLFSSLSVAVRLALPGIDFAELVSKLKAAHREISSIHKPGAIVQEPASGHISIRSILVQAWDARRFAGSWRY